VIKLTATVVLSIQPYQLYLSVLHYLGTTCDLPIVLTREELQEVYDTPDPEMSSEINDWLASILRQIPKWFKGHCILTDGYTNF
jgi:hypothetical protein